MLSAFSAAFGVAAPATVPAATQPAFHARVAFAPPGDGEHDGAWELAVPNAHHIVRLRMREPGKVRDLGDAEVEGLPVLAGTSGMNRMARSITIIAQVSDGRLTLSATRPLRSILQSVEVDEAYSPDRIVSWHTIGWSSPEGADRHVGWDMKRTGWSGFVRRVVEPELRWGVRRIILGNPFGCLAGEDMQFDQYLHAKEAKLTWLTAGFAMAWRPVTDSGVEVVAYLGKLNEDRSFPPLATDPAGWERRFWESVQPALDAKMSVALDASAGDLPESFRAADLLEAKGVKVYVEPRPNVNAPRWFRYPLISVDSFWERSDPALYPDSNWGARNEQLTGEILRLINAPPEGKTWGDKGWIGPYVKRILRDGHTAAVPVRSLMLESVSLTDVLAK